MIDSHQECELEGLKNRSNSHSDKSIKYYINGKLSTKEEMDKLNPNDIATVNVNKNVNNGKEEGEIRIQNQIKLFLINPSKIYKSFEGFL